MVLLKAKFVVAAVVAVTAVGSGVGVLRQPAASATAIPSSASRTAKEPTVAELKRENERLRKEVAALKERLAKAEARAARQLEDDMPTDAEVLRALPKDVAGNATVTRNDIVIVKVKILDQLDQAREYPKVGPARLRRQHWECTVYYTETTEAAGPGGARVTKPRAQVVYIDKDSLVAVGGGMK